MSPDFSPRILHACELVLNWHITEACNYRCGYCYAKWQDAERGRELIHGSASTRRLLEELHGFFSPHNRSNPLRRDMAWDSVRLNLAGGEPLLYGGKVVEILKLARKMGFSTSLISNGSRLDPVLMADLAPHLSMLGLSLDSADESINRGIGRLEMGSKVLDIDVLAETIALGRRLNPGLKLKINTVTNALNWREDMGELVRRLRPEKWKVLRMLPTVTDALVVTDAEFQAFVDRHQGLARVMCVEDNTNMAESYLMIDPYGRFFQNTLGCKGYDYSAPILDVGAGAAFAQVAWSSRKFCARYAGQSLRRAA